MRRVLVVLASAGALALIPALATAAGPHVCRGTSKKPGVLKGGNYPDGVVVQGFCEVSRGPARVTGTVDVEDGSALIAAFGQHHSRLTVVGDVLVERGASLLLGCNTTSFPCVDDPASRTHKKPTLTSKPRITGDLTGSGALGIIVHSAAIGGNVSQSGGGGGKSCAPPKKGPFAMFHSPVFSDYEDNTLYHDLSVTELTSCYLGIARNNVQNLRLVDNTLGDKDAIEVLKNQVLDDLACFDNSRVWDSAEAGHSLYPRKLERNSVAGQRFGQCRKAAPVKKGSKSAGGPF